MNATEQILAAPAATKLAKSVQAQVAVAFEHYGGMLAASANGFGLPAEAAARNLFDLVVGTLYLIENQHLVDDFIEFGQLTFYHLMRDVGELPQYQQSRARDLARYDAEVGRLEGKFKGKNVWHGRQVRQIATDVGMGALYATAYKPASAIIHGSSYPILNRNDGPEWVIAFERQRWDRYVKGSPVYGYLMLRVFYAEVFRLFQIADTTHLGEMDEVCARFSK